MNQSQDIDWQAFADIPQELLARLLRPDHGGIDAQAVLCTLAQDYARDPARWQAAQQNWHTEQQALWSAMAHTNEGAANEPVTSDRRFRAAEWRLPYFNWLARSYLAASTCLMTLVEGAQLDAHEKKRALFLIRQWVHAASPANVGWSNPEALRLAAETQGGSVASGIANLRADMPKGMVSMTDDSAFEVGRNLATTPGAVVFENELLQLIQYRPATNRVHARPLLMVPPCINKFYVLDLQEENSLVRYAVASGHTVFMLSWRNPDASMGRITWDDYVRGVIEAIEIAAKIRGVKSINTLGFCVGGTLLATAIAVLRARRKRMVASVTLLATMLDFCDTGELSVFIDEAGVQKREREFAQAANGGLVPARELALTFASLRPDELIWQYVVNNYLKGRTPAAFDLLHWNSDGANLPGAMYVWYVRNAYLENNLKQPGKVNVCNVPLDLTRIDVPAYMLATREDHIVPWKTAYAGAHLLTGRKTFVLGASGHIAGVINPAVRKRRNFWTADSLPVDAGAWLADAQSHPGSWWGHWSAWLARQAGKKQIASTELGGAGYTEIEPAPGRYVKQKADL